MRKPRGFPPPWSVEEQAACFVVRDQNRQQLAYVYFEDEPGRRSAAKLLGAADRGEYREITGAIAQRLIYQSAGYQQPPRKGHNAVS
jgi:hypothetical protein